MTIQSTIAKIGVNPTFIAFNAHCFFAAFVVSTFFSADVIWAAIAIAAVKEFWFDATYESPKQTFDDNLTDFIGYASGIVLAILGHVLLK